MQKETIKLLKKQVNNLSFFILILNIFFIGASLNFMAVINNKGKMPVLFSDYQFEFERHFSFSNCDEIRYCYLTDIFTIAEYHFSVGDFFITASLLTEIVIAVKIWSVKLKLKIFEKK